MFGRKNSKQEGGDNSTNLQGQSIIINQGLSYADAKAIALDVFRANYVKLSEKAAKTAFKRVEDFTEDFIKKLENKIPDAISSIEDPGMQSAIYTAQKEYAKTGDKDLSDMLVDLLVERAGQQERNLKQIVLDESLSVLPKLTNTHLDILTVNFLFLLSSSTYVKDLNTFILYLNKYILPLIPNLSKGRHHYQHIEYTGCGSSTSIISRDLMIEIYNNYKGIFQKGFTKESFEADGSRLDYYTSIILNQNSISGQTEVIQPFVVSSGEPNLFVVNASNDDQLKQNTSKLNDSKRFDKLLATLNNSLMNHDEAKAKILEMAPFMSDLFDIWNNSGLNSLDLTSVGISISVANLKRKTDMVIDIGTWIK